MMHRFGLISTFTYLLLAIQIVSTYVRAENQPQKLLNSGQPKALISEKAQSLKIPHQMPSMVSDADKAQYLFYIQEHIPGIFDDAATYHINLFELLDDQTRLTDKLQALKPYRDGWSKRQNLIEATVQLNSNKTVKEYSIDPQALKKWKRELQEVLDGLPPGASIKQAEAKLLKRVINESPNGLLSGLISMIDPSKRTIFRGKAIAEQIELLRQELPARLPSAFKGSYYGLPMNATSDQALEQLETFVRNKNELKVAVAKNLNTQLLLSKNAPQIALEKLTSESRTFHDASHVIEGLTTNDLLWANDLVDVVRPGLKNLGVKQKLIQALDKDVHRFSESFSKQLVSTQKEIKGKITLMEVPPGVGIFRGCVSQDCSSQMSFPYPNDPNERVFFILDEQKHAKGIVSGTIVDVGGKPHFYAITISGSHLSSVETNLVFNGLEKIKNQLGVEGIILPHKDRISSLINHNGPANIYDELVSDQPTHAIDYRNRDVRRAIQKFDSNYNKTDFNYDHIESNQEGVLLKPEKLRGHGEVSVEIKSSQWKFEPANLNKETLLEFAMNLDRSYGRGDELDRVLKLLNLDQNEFEALNELFKNTASHPMATYMAKVNQRLEHLLNVPMKNLNPKLLDKIYQEGFIRASNRFSPTVANTSERLLMQRLKGLDLTSGLIEETGFYHHYFWPLFRDWNNISETSSLKKIGLQFLEDRGWGIERFDEIKYLKGSYPREKKYFGLLTDILENPSDPSYAHLNRALENPLQRQQLIQLVRRNPEMIELRSFIFKWDPLNRILPDVIDAYINTQNNIDYSGLIRYSIEKPEWVSEKNAIAIRKVVADPELLKKASYNFKAQILTHPKNPSYHLLIKSIQSGKVSLFTPPTDIAFFANIKRSAHEVDPTLLDLFEKNRFLYHDLGERFMKDFQSQIKDSPYHDGDTLYLEKVKARSKDIIPIPFADDTKLLSAPASSSSQCGTNGLTRFLKKLFQKSKN